MWTYKQNPQSEDIIHFGIKGMKWGVRRSLAQLGRALKGKPSTGSKPASSAPAKPKPKSLSEMSDSELRAKLDRINMERQYKQYLAEMSPKKESMVKRVAMKLLEGGLTTVGNKAISNMADNLFRKSETDDPMSFTDLDLKKIGPKKAAALATYAKNIRKIEAYVRGDPIKDD